MDEGLTFVAARLDDVVVAGDTKVVLKALQIASPDSPRVDLQISLRRQKHNRLPKTCAFPTAGQSPTMDLQGAAEIAVNTSRCLSLLGVPTGDEDF